MAPAHQHGSHSRDQGLQLRQPLHRDPESEIVTDTQTLLLLVFRAIDFLQHAANWPLKGHWQLVLPPNMLPAHCKLAVILGPNPLAYLLAGWLPPACS